MKRPGTRGHSAPARLDAPRWRMGLFIRTIGLGRATVKIGIANLAYYFRRLIWLVGRTAPV
ncbi:hypothetical protein CHT98_13440 (plasmid) [Azospirillum brasilense]|uniref:Transposase n=1 Tax=Azospirillum brasilense TaxID=192 RepID=A0A235HD97_AZOBR|nr:hypothetical protein CHT98_13440 [Azospirillum brasilense]